MSSRGEKRAEEELMMVSFVLTYLPHLCPAGSRLVEGYFEQGSGRYHEERGEGRGIDCEYLSYRR
jgi:hypothetical protein